MWITHAKALNFFCSLMLSLFDSFFLFFIQRDAHSQLLTLPIVLNIRSHHPCMCTIYSCVCLFNRRLSSLLFYYGRDLFFYDVIAVVCNNEQSMMRVKKKRESKIDTILLPLLLLLPPSTM